MKAWQKRLLFRYSLAINIMIFAMLFVAACGEKQLVPITSAKHVGQSRVETQPEQTVSYSKMNARIAKINARKEEAKALRKALVKQSCTLDFESGGFHAVESGRDPNKFGASEECEDGALIQVHLVPFQDLSVDSIDEALSKIEEMGCRPADWSVLLPFHIQYPDFFLDVIPVAPGTMLTIDIDGLQGALCIMPEDSSPMLAWCRFENDFENSRFLLICK